MKNKYQRLFTHYDNIIVIVVVATSLVLLPAYIAIFISLVIAIALCIYNRKNLIGQLGIKSLSSWQFKRVLLKGVAVAIIFFLFVIPVLSFLLNEEVDPYPFDAFFDVQYSYLQFVNAIIWAPLIEELLFRRYLLEGVNSIIKGKIGVWAAVIVTSVLFGFLHSELGMLNQVTIVIVGFLFAFTYLKHQRNTTASIVLHGSYNLVSLLILYSGASEFYWEFLWTLGL